MDHDTTIKQTEDRLVFLRGQIVEVKQQLKALKTEAFRTEGRIMQLRELKAQAAKPEQNGDVE